LTAISTFRSNDERIVKREEYLPTLAIKGIDAIPKSMERAMKKTRF